MLLLVADVIEVFGKVLSQVRILVRLQVRLLVRLSCQILTGLNVQKSCDCLFIYLCPTVSIGLV